MPSRPSSPRLRPCIAELLRTRVHPNSLLLRLEKTVIQTLSQDVIPEADRDGPSGGNDDRKSRERYCRLWLSDGELMIQAVMEQPLHDIFLTEDPGVGSLLDVRRFRVRRGKRIHGVGEVLYLAIASYETLLSASPATPTQADDFVNEGGFLREESNFPVERKYMLRSPMPGSLQGPPSPEMPSAPSSQDSDGFETVKFDLEVLDRRRKALHKLNSNAQSAALLTSSRDQTPKKRRRLLDEKEAPPTTSPAGSDGAVGFAYIIPGTVADATVSYNSQLQATLDESLASQQLTRLVQPSPTPDAAIESITSARVTPPLHTLSSLLYPPPHAPLPSRNYTCSILAIVSWCSPNLIYPRHAQSPFPPKRHIKIHDPSIASRYAGITLAVYDDARTFKPRVGTVALFRGVVMQRWESEVILNAYARMGSWHGDRGEHGESGWYVDREERLVAMGYDVREMKDWWAERSHSNGPKRVI